MKMLRVLDSAESPSASFQGETLRGGLFPSLSDRPVFFHLHYR